jgi:hypothetical protein
MTLAVIILLAVEIGGLLVIYAVLRERLRREASAAAQSQELREEVGRLVVELNQTTDRNIALVEDAIARLNELLARADKKIGLLRRETDKHDGGMQMYSRLAEVRAVPAAAPLPGPAAAAASRPDVPAARAGVPPAAGPGAAEARTEVVRLARLGFAPALIAGRVGLPLGEVELIVALERRMATGPLAESGREGTPETDGEPARGTEPAGEGEM